MSINLTNLIDLDGLRAFKTKNDEARDSAISEALDDYKKFDFVDTNSEIRPGSIHVPVRSDVSNIISGTGTADDPYIVDFTVVFPDGDRKVYYKTTSSADSTASVASTSDDDRYYTESEINTLLLSKVYPVGAIYISVNSVNPGTLFGGTWEKIKDRFLLASGDTYSIGSTGGNSSTTLGIANLPSHNHTGTTGNESQGHTHSGTTGNQSANHTHTFSGTTSSNGSHNHNAGHGWHNTAAGSDRHCLSNSYIGEDGWSGNVTSSIGSHAHNFSGTTGGISANHNHSFTTGGISASHTHDFTTSSVGSTEAFSNMPPYLTVNIWKRTA